MDLRLTSLIAHQFRRGLRATSLALAGTALVLACTPDPAPSNDNEAENADDDGTPSAEADSGASEETDGGVGAHQNPDRSDPDAGDESGDVEPAIHIVSPVADAKLTGLTTVELELTVPENRADLDVLFGVDEDRLSVVRDPTSTLQIKTYGLEDGEHELIAQIRGPEDELYEDRVTIIIDNPDLALRYFEVSPKDVRNGDLVTVELEFNEAVDSFEVDLSELDDRFSADDVQWQELDDNRYQLTYAVSRENDRKDAEVTLWLKAHGENGETIPLGLPVRLRNVPKLPIRVQGGQFVDAPAHPSAVSRTTAPLGAAEIEAPSTLLGSGSAVLQLRLDEPLADVPDKLIISAPGFSGYYMVPLGEQALVEGPDETLSVEVSLPAQQPEFFTEFPDIELDLTLLTELGESIANAIHTFTVLNAGDNAVGATLKWNSGADMDIAVIDPNGNLIDFETPELGTGKLQLDSNAFCEDGTRTENISWPLGEAPIGIYKVRVNLYDSCGVENTTWSVQAHFCGQSLFKSDSISAGSADTSGTGRQVMEFEVECTHVVRGRATYEKKGTIRPAGSSPAGSPEPIRNAQIQVKNADNNAVIETAKTDDDGKYVISFFNPTETNYYVEVEATWDDPAFIGRVKYLRVNPVGGSVPHTSASATLDGARNPNAVELNVHVPESNIAGAFNIREIMIRSVEWLNETAPTIAAARVKRGIAQWGRGVPTFIPGNPTSTSFHDPGPDVLMLNGDVLKQSEWDDSVIAHEFFHHVTANLKLTPDYMGLGHLPQMVPQDAWTEGLASALGQLALKNPIFSTEHLSVISHRDLETGAVLVAGPSGAPVLQPTPATDFGTSTGASTGNVSEWAVAIMVYDTMDTSTGEPHDRFTPADIPFSAKAMFEHAPGMSFADADGNGVDFVDFVNRHRSMSSNAHEQAWTCVLLERAFPYTPLAGQLCPP